MDRTGGLSAIGNTPLVRLARMADDGCAEVWVKMEAANPTGSYKDRMALAMIEAAEADGRLRPGQLVVEYTGGSTGSSLAFVCAVKGYPLRIVSSDAFAEEKIRTMRAFGAEVELIASPGGITPDLIPAMVRRAAEIAAQTGAGCDVPGPGLGQHARRLVRAHYPVASRGDHRKVLARPARRIEHDSARLDQAQRPGHPFPLDVRGVLVLVVVGCLCIVDGDDRRLAFSQPFLPVHAPPELCLW
jgi:Pyridoxal-phosphate dependent enzyme